MSCRHLYQFASVRNVLIFIYILPLLVLTIAFFESQHFKQPSLISESFVAMVDVYLANTRDTLGSFMLPFLTANTFAELRKENSSQVDNEKFHNFFYVLVGIFMLSIFVYCLVTLNIESLISNLNETNESKVNQIKLETEVMTKSYIKETIGFIALMLGIEKSSEANK